MAAGAGCKVRMDTGPAAWNIINQSKISKKIDRGASPVIFQMAFEGTFSNGFAEVSAPNSVFNGVAVPIIVYAISSSASDDSGGADHAQTVKLLGIDENDAFIIVEIALNGQVQVATTVKFKRLIHAWVNNWGSGGQDAAGNITITNTGQAATYLTIAAGSNESDGMALWLVDGMQYNISHIDFKMTTSANANAALLIKESRVNFGNGSDPDYDYHQWRSSISTGDTHESDDDIHTADAANAKITISETYLGNAENGWFELHIIVWTPV